MSGEQVVTFGTQKTLSSAGASIASGSLALATDAGYDVGVDGVGFPDAVFALEVTFATAPVENSLLALYAQPLNIDGSLGTLAPETTRPTRCIGYFNVDNSTALQPIELVAYDLPRKANYYVHNVNTGQAISSGWVLKVTPRAFKVQ